MNRSIRSGSGVRSPPSIAFDATTSTIVVLDVANITAAARSDNSCAAAPSANATSGVLVVAVAAGAVDDTVNAHPHNNHPKRKQFEGR